MELTSAPVLEIPTRSPVLAVEFCPFEWAKNLIAVALPKSLAVHSIKFEEETEDEVELEQVWECHVDSETVDIAWGPSTSFRTSGKCLELLVATENYKVIQLSTDLNGTDTVNEQCSHEDHINSIAYSGDSGEFAASAGSDLVCKVWRPQTSEFVAKFLLGSAGMSVMFQPDDPNILLVGEHCGVIRIYNISTGLPLVSLQSPAPVLDVDWMEMTLLAAGPKAISLWELDSIDPPNNCIPVGESLITKAKLSKSSAGLVATLSSPYVLRVSHIHANRVPMVVNLKAANGLSWHLQLPYLAVGSDRNVLLWRVEI